MREHEHHDVDDDLVDGCDIDFAAEPTSDDDLDALVLFADVDTNDPAAVEARRREWEALFHGS